MLNFPIRNAELNFKAWRQTLADLEFRTGEAPDGMNYDDELDRSMGRIRGDDSEPQRDA